MRILLAGTRNEQLKKMKRALERAHCSAECVHDREAALDLCMDDCYDCIALEAAPFCENPPEWIGGLRDAGVTTPLLLLAARGERRLGVAALNAGADDFILPPLSMAEFVARARALARRNGGFAAQALTWGDVTLDTQAFELRTAAGKSFPRHSPSGDQFRTYRSLHRRTARSQGSWSNPRWGKCRRSHSDSTAHRRRRSSLSAPYRGDPHSSGNLLR